MDRGIEIIHDCDFEPVMAGLEKGSVVDAAPIKRCFSAITEWTRAACEVGGADQAPQVCIEYLPEEYRRSLRRPSQECEAPQGLIAFDIAGPGNTQARTRYMLPLHFMTMRALELVPGLRLYLKDETRGNDEQSARVRSPSEKIYRINLSIDSITQAVGRLLFNVPVGAELHERRTPGAHRCIIPQNHVITRLRKQDLQYGPDQVMDVIEYKLRRQRYYLGYPPKDMIILIKTLLALGDRWHWDDLEDRLREEARREFPAIGSSAPEPIG